MPGTVGIPYAGFRYITAEAHGQGCGLRASIPLQPAYSSPQSLSRLQTAYQKPHQAFRQHSRIRCRSLSDHYRIRYGVCTEVLPLRLRSVALFSRMEPSTRRATSAHISESHVTSPQHGYRWDGQKTHALISFTHLNQMKHARFKTTNTPDTNHRRTLSHPPHMRIVPALSTIHPAANLNRTKISRFQMNFADFQ